MCLLTTYYVVIVDRCCISFFFFNDTATTEIYTLSLHDALPISARSPTTRTTTGTPTTPTTASRTASSGHDPALAVRRSEEHTSELQSRQYLVCRLLLEKKKQPTASLLSLLANRLSDILPITCTS